MDVRLAAFGKLCAGFDTTYGTRGEAGLATDQVSDLVLLVTAVLSTHPGQDG